MSINDEAVQRFGEQIGIPKLRFNADRVCALTVADGLEITLEDAEIDGRLRINGRVGFVRQADPEIWRALLVANHNGQATGPATLSVDPSSGDVVLGQTVEVRSLDGPGLAAIVEMFLKYLTFWVGHLPSMKPAVTATETIAPEEMLIRI